MDYTPWFTFVNVLITYYMDAHNNDTKVYCKLTSAELQARKKTVLANLRGKLLERKELENGIAFRFPGSDEVLDELMEFVKTERACCSFFIFNLSFGGDGKEAWLSLTGPDGTKQMIKAELGLQ